MDLLIPTHSTESWRTVNDDVMGGISESNITHQTQGLRFSGKISKEFGGGFASAHRRLSANLLANTKGLVLSAKGDQREYQLRVKCSTDAQSPSWRVCFFANEHNAEQVFPWAAFRPVFRGKRLRHTKALNPDGIVQIGLMLNDGQAGDFELHLSRLAALF